jgi:hypothetical protein
MLTAGTRAMSLTSSKTSEARPYSLLYIDPVHTRNAEAADSCMRGWSTCSIGRVFEGDVRANGMIGILQRTLQTHPRLVQPVFSHERKETRALALLR